MRNAARQDAPSSPKPYVVPPSREFDGNDGSWSTFKISVGTPGQDFRVLASTRSGVTSVVIPEGCIEGVDPPDCANLRGAEIFNSAQNPGFQLNMSSTWSTIGQYSIDLENRLNYTGDGIFGYDKVSLGAAADSNSLSLDHQVVTGAPSLDYWLGYVGLGIAESSFSSLSQPIDAFLYQLRNGTKIPSLSFAYTAGAKYRLKSVFGSLILGGYDSTRFKPNTNDFSFTFSQDPSRLLTVSVESITATNTLKGTYSLSSSAHFSQVDSTVPHLWLPRDICDGFEEAFGLIYDPQTDLYLVNDTMHSELLSRNPSVTLKLVNSPEDTLTDYVNIALPYAAFDLQASYPIYQNATNYFPIRRAANDSQYTLGRTLLQEAYLIVDYERANFTISQAAFPDPLPAANIIPINPPSNNSSGTSGGGRGGSGGDEGGLSTGAIGGIAGGGAVLLIAIIIGLIFFCRRRRRNKRRFELANTQVSDSGSRTGFYDGSSPQPYKSPAHPQELGGTPLTELASPGDGYAHSHGRDQKSLSPNQVHELPTPMRPRWREVTAEHYHEMDGESVPSRDVSRLGSRSPSEDGRYTGVSPLTGQFHGSPRR